MKYLKTYKVFEASHEEIMDAYYGTDVVSECNSIIEDIKDMILELTDTGLFTTVGYTPMTLSYQEKNDLVWEIKQITPKECKIELKNKV